MEIKHIILASGSPRRKELLEKHGIKFSICRADIDEVESGSDPKSVCAFNALEKAKFVARRNPNEVVLGADTIVVLGNRIFGKPADKADAVRILFELKGREHSVYTAVAIVRKVKNGFEKRESICESKVTFKDISAKEIAEYMSKVNVMDKAGAYAAQEEGSLIISKIDGDFENVMGLPCRLVLKELNSFAEGYFLAEEESASVAH